MVFKDLEKEHQCILDEWQTLSSSTKKWMKDTAARAEAQDSPTPAQDLIRAQKQDMEVSVDVCCATPLLTAVGKHRSAFQCFLYRLLDNTDRSYRGS